MLTIIISALFIICIVNLYQTIRNEKKSGEYRELFIHNLVHNLKRPVENQMKACYLLRKSLPEKQMSLLERSRQQLNEILQSINRMLLQSTDDHGLCLTIRDFNLQEALEALTQKERWGTQTDKQFDIQVDFRPDNPIIRGDHQGNRTIKGHGQGLHYARTVILAHGHFGAEMTKTILGKENFDVETVPDGVKAWNIYKEWKPDILLLDLDMPGKDGLELTCMVRERDQQTHIIVYTSHGEPAKEVAVLDAGADEFINKGRPPEVLTAYMKRVREKIKKSMNIYCAKNHEVASKSYLLRGIWNKADINKESELKKYASRVRANLKADPTLQIECRDSGYILMCVS